MRNVNGHYTLECDHRRHVPAALNERSLLVSGLALPRTKSLVISSAVRSFDAQVDSPPIEMRRADVVYDFLQMPTNANKPSRTFSEEFGGNTPGSCLRDTRFLP